MLKVRRRKDPAQMCSSSPSCSKRHPFCLSTTYFVPYGYTFWSIHSRPSSSDTFSYYYCFSTCYSAHSCTHHQSQTKHSSSIYARQLPSQSMSLHSSSQYATAFSMKSTWKQLLRIPHCWTVATRCGFWGPAWLSRSCCPSQRRNVGIGHLCWHGATAFAGQGRSSCCACWVFHGIEHWTWSSAKIWSLLIGSTLCEQP